MADAARVAVVIRYDDCLMVDTGTVPAPEVRQIEAALARFHAAQKLPAVFAVVPAGCREVPGSEDAVGAVREACVRGSEVALHGYSHANMLSMTSSIGARTWARFCQRTQSEFGGLPREEQIRRMRQGKGELEALLELPVRVFIPPWNAYDAGTIIACRETDIDVLSVSRAWPVPDADGLSLVPQTTGEGGLERAVEHGLRGGLRAVVVCVLHTTNLSLRPVVGRLGIARWQERLLELRERRGVRLVTIGELGRSGFGEFDATRLRRHRRRCAIMRVMARATGSSRWDVRREVYWCG